MSSLLSWLWLISSVSIAYISKYTSNSFYSFLASLFIFASSILFVIVRKYEFAKYQVSNSRIRLFFETAIITIISILLIIVLMLFSFDDLYIILYLPAAFLFAPILYNSSILKKHKRLMTSIANLQIEKIEDLSIGESVEIKISYPNSGGSIVIGWKDQTVEIIEGAEIIEISGLTVKGLKAGTAVIRVSATTVISEIALEQGEEEKIYSTTAQITVR